MAVAMGLPGKVVVEVRFADSQYNYRTEVNGTVHSARDYFMGNGGVLNLGSGAKDNCQQVTAVELVEVLRTPEEDGGLSSDVDDNCTRYDLFAVKADGCLKAVFTDRAKCDDVLSIAKAMGKECKGVWPRHSEVVAYLAAGNEIK